MNELFSYFIESLVAFGIFYVFYILIIEKQNAFLYSRFYLLSTSLLSLVFPLIKINVVSSFFTLNHITSAFLVNLDEVIITNSASGKIAHSVSVSELFLWIYFSGLFLAAVSFTIKLSGLLSFIRKFDKKQSGKYYLLSGNCESLSFSFFNYIFIGKARDLSESDKNRIMQHEMTHVNQMHSYDSIYFEILGILFWFNPFIWLYKNMIVDLHEYLADEEVLKITDREEYSRLLVHQVIGFSDLKPASHFKNSKTIKRIKKMKSYTEKTNKLILAMILPVILIVFSIISCNSDKRELQPQSTAEQLSEQPRVGNTGVVDSGQSVETIYENVDKMPEPVGGFGEFYKYIAMNMKYPLAAREKGIEGKVLVNFEVDKEGNVKNVNVLKGIGIDCDQEAVNIVSNSPKWNPGYKEGNPVNVRMVLPIIFRLDSKTDDMTSKTQGELNPVKIESRKK